MQTVRQHPKVALIALTCICEKCRKSFIKQLPSSASEDAFKEVKVGKGICDVVTCKNGEANLAIEHGQGRWSFVTRKHTAENIE